MQTTNFGFSSMRLKSGIVSACAVALIVAASVTAGCGASSESEEEIRLRNIEPVMSAERAEDLARLAQERAASCNQRGGFTRSECFDRALRSVCEDESADAGWSAADKEQCRDQVIEMTEFLLEIGELL